MFTFNFGATKKEAEAFQKKVKRSNLSREAYLRHLVNGLTPQDAPPPDYYAMMRELHGIGNNLNQTAAKVRTPCKVFPKFIVGGEVGDIEIFLSCVACDIGYFSLDIR